MEAALAAARIGDEIEHSNAMLGFAIGAAVGLGVGLAILGGVVAAPFTGGLSLCATAAAVSAMGGIVAGVGAGAVAGGVLGGLMTAPAGPITTGSSNVFINGIAAARAVIDVVACTKHSAPPQRIAQGSKTVFINGYPAARKTDKTECDGPIIEGSPDVTIGAEAETYIEISPEIPAWMSDTAKWMMIIGGGVALGAGLFGAALGGLAAVGTFVGQIALGAAVSAGGKVLGGALGEALWGEKGRIAGETIGEMLGIPGAQNGIRGLRGHPIDVATGELVIEAADFSLPGPLPLTWARRWSSGSGHDGDLGHGWTHPFDMAIEVLGAEGLVKARLEDGRLAFFPLPAPGAPTLNLPERLVLHVEDDGYRIATYDGLSYRFARTAGALRRLAGVRDASGNAILLHRGADGRLLALDDSSGRRLTVSHDANGRIVAVDGPHPDGEGAQRFVAYAYGTEGDLVSAVDPRGGETRYRTANHLIVEERRRSGLTFHFRWDDPALGRRARCIETWGDGRLYYCRFAYAPDEKLTVVTDDREQETLYRYNTLGLVVFERDSLGGEQRWIWSDAGALLRYSDAAGRTTSYAYDTLNRLTQQTAADGASVTTEYPAIDTPADLASPIIGLPIAASLPDGGMRHYGYDARGQVSSIATPMGREVRFLRDARGLPLAISDQLGVLSRYDWDASGMLAAEGDGAGNRLSYRYDRLGRVSALLGGGDDTDYERDAAGNVVRITRRRDGKAVQLAYDAEDNVVLHQGPDGRQTRWDYAGLPFPVSRTTADGRTVQYRYDHTLNLIALVNPKGEEHRLLRDPLGRVTREIGFDGRAVDYRYDAGGKLLERRTEQGVTRYDRDATGLVVGQTYPDGRAHRFDWDASGRLIAAATPDRTIAFRYDGDGRLVAERQDGLETQHRYDLRGRRLATILPDGREIAVSFEDGGFTAVTLDKVAVARVERDRHGRETLRQAGAVEVASDYDAEGRLVRQSGRVAARGGGGDTVLGRLYHYDPVGRLLALEDMVRGTRRFRHDAADRLVGVEGATPEAFVTDPAGNLLPVGPNGVNGVVEGNRLRVWGDRRFEYDGDGRRVCEWRGAGHGHELRYAYNGAGMLAEVVDTSRRGTRITRFGYDALGRRAFKDSAVLPPAAANEGSDAPEPQFARTWFQWDGDALLAEATARDTGQPADPFETLYLHEPGSLRPLAQARRTAPDAPAALHHYHLDLLGTPQELTNDNGKITWRAELRAWGSVARQAEADVANPIRFQGQYADEETGLHYNRCRYYDPVVARYVTPDPIGLAGGDNAYAYVPDPTTWIDPFGLTACKFDWNALRLREVGTGRFHPWRADPKTYMSARDIDAHLAPFRGGAAKIVKFNPTETIGPNTSHFDKGVYVMTRGDAEGIIKRTGGDPRLMEKELGLNAGDLGDKPNLITIDNPGGLRVPSGNETGANEHWVRGGYTSGGIREAVVDPIPPSDYNVIPIRRGP